MGIINNKEDLLIRLMEGDDAAFNVIYNTYYIRLHHFIDEYLNDSDNSNDVVQNVFAKLWQNRSGLNENTNLAAWLFTVARNETLSLLEHRMIIDRHRTGEQLRLYNKNYEALKEMKLSEDNYSEIVDILQATLARLTPQCRMVFECSRFRLMSNRDIANYLSISVKTVEAHMTKALKTLRIALSDYL